MYPEESDSIYNQYQYQPKALNDKTIEQQTDEGRETVLETNGEPTLGVQVLEERRQ